MLIRWRGIYTHWCKDDSTIWIVFMEKNQTEGQSELLSSSFEQLDPALRAKLEATQSKVLYAEKQYIHYAGDEAKHLFFVNRGAVRITKCSESGKEFIIKDLTQGEWFGVIGCFGGGTRPNDAIALVETELIQFSLADFMAVADQNPQLWHCISHQLAQYVVHYNRRLEDIVFQPLMERTKAMLAQLSRWQNTDTLAMSQMDLACLLGVTKEAVGLQLNKLQAEGVISLGYRNITLNQNFKGL